MHHKKLLILLACSMFATAANVAAQSPTPNPPRPLPNPVLYLMSTEPYTANGKDFTRYRYGVDNFSVYPDEMFAAAPNLPPCGQNTKSSRSWVDIFDMRGKRLYGFCALGKSSDLNSIWFSVEAGEIPPSYVYIEIKDRQTDMKYKSNLAETVE
ncbi:MAG TPA: hypothetical protein VJV03_03935 [Pyrinomonadaceae bacterium]|nr:hypothetical protein [Pyrinomonadaceae bacterium]